ncbi:MAG: hypothetical protein CVV03_00655 [Firmicutes bacterium HGW-Firmicutes-8]|nr:MAG: hypothetical protein CVV03_00655 [Firmicutes bacterium HGW-Firmicutes-8]
MGRSKKQAVDNETNVVLYLLMAILFLTPLFRGLFFDKEMLIAGIVITGLFSWYMWSGGYKRFLNYQLQIVDFALLGLTTAYLISTVVAVKISAAVNMDLKMVIFLMVYILVLGLASSAKETKKILIAMYFSGVTVALAGLAAFGGAAIKGGVIAGRIASTFQYPNTLGAYLAVIGILGCFFTLTASNRNSLIALAVGNLLVFTALFGTASRGTFVILPITYLTFILLQHGRNRLLGLIFTLINFAVGGLTGYLITGELGTPGIWGYVFTGMIINVLLYLALDWFIIRHRVSEAGNRKAIAAALLLILAVLIVAGAFVLPKAQVLTRLMDISFQERNVVERGYFYKDAIKIIKEFPLFGTGGGGWTSIYQQYQSYGYKTLEIHNFYLQTWVEAGVLGIISICLIFLGVLRSYYKIRKTDESENNVLAVTVLTAIIIIGLQSAIDFVLANGAIYIMLWSLFGILSRLSGTATAPRQSTVKQDFKLKLLKYSPVIVSLLVAGLCFSILTALIYSEKAIEAMNRSDFFARKKHLEQALTFNPLEGYHYANLAVMERALFEEEQSKEHINTALEYINKAINRDQGNQAFRAEKINILLSLEKFDNAVQEAEAVVELVPWSLDSYELLAYCYWWAGEYHLKNGDRDKAKANLMKTVEVPELIDNKMNQLTEEEKKLWIATPHLTISPAIQEYVKKARLLLETIS